MPVFNAYEATHIRRKRTNSPVTAPAIATREYAAASGMDGAATIP